LLAPQPELKGTVEIRPLIFSVDEKPAADKPN
jgi:hypothetical protein